MILGFLKGDIPSDYFPFLNSNDNFPTCLKSDFSQNLRSLCRRDIRILIPVILLTPKQITFSLYKRELCTKENYFPLKRRLCMSRYAHHYFSLDYSNHMFLTNFQLDVWLPRDLCLSCLSPVLWNKKTDLSST